MSTDIRFTYADEMLLAATTNSATTTTLISDIVNHKNVGGRGPGPNSGLYLVISVDATFVGPSTTAVFLFTQDSASSFSGPTTLGTYTAPIALATAGTVIANVPLPTITEQYTRVTGSWSTAATGGSVSIYVTDSPQANES